MKERKKAHLNFGHTTTFGCSSVVLLAVGQMKKMTGRHIVWKSVGHNYCWAAVCQVSVAGDSYCDCIILRFGRRICHGIIMILVGAIFLVVLLVHKGKVIHYNKLKRVK